MLWYWLFCGIGDDLIVEINGFQNLVGFGQD